MYIFELSLYVYCTCSAAKLYEFIMHYHHELLLVFPVKKQQAIYIPLKQATHAYLASIQMNLHSSLNVKHKITHFIHNTLLLP